MADATARSILGALIMSPGLLTASDEICADLFTPREKLVFNAISAIWEDRQPEQIELPILADRLGDKVSAAYLASLLDGLAGVQPDGFVNLVNELARQRVAKAIVKTVSDAGAEIVKTGQVDLETLKPLIEKYESIGEKEKVISAHVREWAYQSSGDFSVPMVYKDLGARTVQEQGLVRVVLHTLVKEGVITQVGKGHGHYRKLEKELEEVNLLGTIPEPVDLYLPLKLDSLVKIYPRSIIVVAGSGNRGKTAVAHDFLKHNMNKHECHLLFSEGGAESLRDRLDKHTDKMIGEWCFKAYPKTQHFADSIFPDAINIVDYMLIPDRFWEVGSYLDDIYRKLNKGIAYVNIQKDAKAEAGRGGDFGLERPQLYVTLSPDNDVLNPEDNVQYGVAKILKAKAWKKRSNPDGKILRFSIEDGWIIRHNNDWNYPTKKEKKHDVGYAYNRR